MMEEPMKLPTSNVTMDFSSIKRMLLNDERDPINRAPLKISDLIPDLELK
jgi:ubiquitin conjugation factor E4 B